jgi:chitinase
MLDEETYGKGEVTLTAKVYDRLLYSDSHSIKIDLGGTDTNSPSVSFIYPSQGDSIPRGTSALIRVAAFDKEGDVQSVRYSLDSEDIGVVSEPPFSLSYRFPDSSGEHTLAAEASDYAGNTARSVITVKFEDTLTFQPATVTLIEPLSGSSHNVSESVSLLARVSSEYAEDITSVEFIVNTAGSLSSGRRTVGTITDTQGGTLFSTSWVPDESSSYDVFVRVRLNDGNTLVSKKARVSVR